MTILVEYYIKKNGVIKIEINTTYELTDVKYIDRIMKSMKIEKKYKEIINWCIYPKHYPNLISKFKKDINKSNEKEKKWGNIIQNNKYINGNWTTLLGENIIKYLYELKGEKIWKPKKINNFCPDWETKDYIIEVKTRSWTTAGTAGEKVLGVPYKYSDIPRLYGKKLIIICIAYQEWELTYGNTRIFKHISNEKKNMLKYWKENLNIEFVKCSDLIKTILQ